MIIIMISDLMKSGSSHKLLLISMKKIFFDNFNLFRRQTEKYLQMFEQKLVSFDANTMD